jgi:hypothetical protein
MHIENKTGQSTVEYILLVTAVVAVMIVFATSNKGQLQTQLCSVLNTAYADVADKASALSASHAGSNQAPNGAIESLYTVKVTP